MSTKFHQSWQLFKASIAVTFRHRKLLWFPLLISIFTAFIALFFISAIALPAVLHPTGYHLNQSQHWAALKDYYFPTPVRSGKGPARSDSENTATVQPSQNQAAGPVVFKMNFALRYSLLLVIYLTSMFLATFFNVAFYSEIMAAFDGRGVSFRRGLQTARSRLPSILAWSLLAGVVGWIIRTIEERLPFAGRIMMGLIGMAWSIAAVFAIPVIIQTESNRNPIKVLQQSALTLKRTWGEGLIGYLGFSAGSLIMFFGSLLPLLVGLVIAAIFERVAIAVISGVLWVICLLVMSYISSVASHVYRCALYKYATEGAIPQPYSQELMDVAWKVKKGRE